MVGLEKLSCTNTVYSVGGDLLTSTGAIVVQWEDYFKELLNALITPSTEEAEAGDSEVDNATIQAKVTKVVSKLLSGKASGVDKIQPDYHKSLEDVGLSWLTRRCNLAWHLGTVPLEWQTFLKRWTGGCVRTIRGMYFSSFQAIEVDL